jgi:hypothetical protein
MAAREGRTQPDTPGGDIQESLTVSRNDIIADGKTKWDDTVAIFESTNKQWTRVAKNASALFIASNQSTVLDMLQEPECVVQSSDDHRINGTATLEFLCCHRRRLAPLRRILDMAYTKLTENVADALSTTPEQVIKNINDIMENDLLGSLLEECIDDPSINTPQAQVVRVLGARIVGVDLLCAYEFVVINLSSLLQCIQEPVLPDYCISNQPLELSDGQIAVIAFESNPDVAAVCSAQKLQAFENFRLFPACVYPVNL